MAGGSEDDTEKSEAPTGRRLEKARDSGQVPVSRELVSFAGLAGASLAVVLLLPGEADRLGQALVPFLEGAHGIALRGPAVGDVAFAGARAAVLVGVLAMMLTVMAGLGQTRFLFSAKALAPKWSKLNPFAGLKRLFGPDNLVEFLKSCVKLLVLGGLTWWALAADLPLLEASIGWTPGQLVAAIGEEIRKLLYAVLGVLMALVVLDVLWTRYRHVERLKMSRQDIKEEHKESEGDPQIKARLRRIRLERSRRRMMAAVPDATVVVTNPTHYAVALAYDRNKDAAPRVVAKGADLMAARIRELAEEHRVPIVQNPPLARALFTVELDAPIPEAQFAAVAEVIAFVWRLSQARGGRPNPRPGGTRGTGARSGSAPSGGGSARGANAARRGGRGRDV